MPISARGYPQGMQLEEVSLDAGLEARETLLLVKSDAGRALVHYRPNRKTFHLVTHWPGRPPHITRRIPAQSSLRQALGLATSERPLRAFRIPGGQIGRNWPRLRTFASRLPMVLGVIVVIVGAVVLPRSWWGLLPILLGAMVFTLAWQRVTAHRPHLRWEIQQGRERVLPDQVQLPPLPEPVDVDAIKEEYGKLISDIAYRIEHPALFDPNEPTSKAFTLALLQWDNNDGVVGEEERREQALRVHTTFEAAKANAERLGMSHLPEPVRERAGVALKAARLASDEQASPAERATALERAIAILDDLSLYYLPTGTQARKAITRRAPLALPGRRS